MSAKSDTEDAVDVADLVSFQPKWKRVVWHNISVAAQAKNAFDEDDYDESGNLNMHLAKFDKLREWMVWLSSVAAPMHELLSASPLLTKVFAVFTSIRSPV